MTQRKLKPRRLAAVLAGLTVTGLVTTSLFVSAGGAAAAELDLNYGCTFPLIDVQPVKVHINASIPDTITVGVPTGEFTIEALSTLNEDTTTGLKLVKVATIEGSAISTAHITAPGFDTDLDVPVTVEKTAVPASGGFTVRATGKTPSLKFPQAGPIKITVHDLMLNITARKADGTLASIPPSNPFEAPCVQDPGQNNVLKEGQILPKPTTEPTTPTTTEPTTTQPTTTEPTTTEPTTTEPTTTEPTTTEPTTTEPTTTEPTTTQPTTTEPTTTEPTTTEPTTTQPTTTEPTTTEPTTTEPTTTQPTTTEPTTTEPTTTEPTTTEPTTTQPTTTEPTTTQPTTTQPTTTEPTTTQPTTTKPPTDVIEISYTVKGKTYIKKLNASAVIGPGRLDAKVKLAEGTFAGDLSLPSTKINFALFGFLPAQASVKIVPAGQVTGTIAADGSVKSNVAVDLLLVDVKVFGLPIVGGSSCKSSTSVALASNPGFNPATGGTLSGTYDIRPFANCGMFTSVINSLTAGPGNKIEIALTKK
ncbi:hypothetical protein SAMN05192558_11249 [Actinokineospora alba]|uniref:DUF6801 domain-containing protein n=1 Tax=Actinokineospora alba TaxID=504798 RepID=A0A1H0UT67_9PSEU|nr:DUF6801 domain-containing protein [Actinokineospora alba]TDP69079.1 hypothetical protein C8E96_4650 [Actinokineospora alba]SDP69360.1 hypothetical protein SAMN05192558_11249 [Actinokineospora alba]